MKTTLIVTDTIVDIVAKMISECDGWDKYQMVIVRHTDFQLACAVIQDMLPPHQVLRSFKESDDCVGGLIE
jgi:hypothetical protein